jgi:hypothetical protein
MIPKAHTLQEHSLASLAARAWDGNPRRHDLEAIRASLDRFGYVNLIVIDDTSGRLAAGHGVLASLMLAQQDGHKLPDRVGLKDGQWTVTAVHVQLAEGAVTGYAISDTRTRELGSWHDDLLLDVLRGLAEQDPTLHGIGFTTDDLNALQAKVSGTLPPSFSEIPDDDDPTRPTKKPVACPHCGETFTP